MIPYFDLDKLESLLKDFYALSKIRIVVYDDRFQEVCAYPRQRPTVCRLIRKNPMAEAACEDCDRTACMLAAKFDGPHIYTCHAGLTEAVSALRINSQTIGYLLFGHIFAFPSHDIGWKQIHAAVTGYSLDPGTLETACQELPLVSREHITAAAHIMDVVASFLISQRMATLQQSSTEAELDNYISAHFTENITTTALCSQLGIGKRKLYAISHQIYGCGIAEKIRSLRIEQAKHLLTDEPTKTVAEVALECGYGDYNYFIASFSKIVGQSPGQYRNKHRSSV